MNPATALLSHFVEKDELPANTSYTFLEDL